MEKTTCCELETFFRLFHQKRGGGGGRLLQLLSLMRGANSKRGAYYNFWALGGAPSRSANSSIYGNPLSITKWACLHDFYSQMHQTALLRLFPTICLVALAASLVFFLPAVLEYDDIVLRLFPIGDKNDPAG